MNEGESFRRKIMAYFINGHFVLVYLGSISLLINCKLP